MNDGNKEREAGPVRYGSSFFAKRANMQRFRGCPPRGTSVLAAWKHHLDADLQHHQIHDINR